MMPIHPERMTVKRDEGFVVFLLGARVNRWWTIPVVWGVAMAMGRMLRELAADPDIGLLASESYSRGRNQLVVQYWRSHEHLQRYAHAKERQHVPAWKHWAKRWAEGAVGIWHETYLVSPATYECIYQHMPPTALGRVGPLVPAAGPLRTATGRLGHTARARAEAEVVDVS